MTVQKRTDFTDDLYDFLGIIHEGSVACAHVFEVLLHCVQTLKSEGAVNDIKKKELERNFKLYL